MKVKLYKDNTEAKVMQALCYNCYKLLSYNTNKVLSDIFPKYKNADCDKTWPCMKCGGHTNMVLVRNCKVIENGNV